MCDQYKINIHNCRNYISIPIQGFVVCFRMNGSDCHSMQMPMEYEFNTTFVILFSPLDMFTPCTLPQGKVLYVNGLEVIKRKFRQNGKLSMYTETKL